MNCDWTELTLADVCSKIGSGATPRGGKEVYSPNGPVALIRSQNVHNDSFVWDGLVYIGTSHATELANVEVIDGDVLLNITGDSVARCCQVDPRVLPARVNQHVAIIRPDSRRLDARFLRYALVAPPMQRKMLGMAAAGATRNALTKGMIETLKVPAPVDLQEQRSIAAILGALDDKIEVNRQIAATLEAVARALFTSWFVDFDPVRAKAEGRATGLSSSVESLFSSTMEAVEDLELPSGWERSTLGSEIKRWGGTIQTGPFGSQLHASDYVVEGVPVVMPTNITQRKISDVGIARISQEDASRLSRHQLLGGDIVYSRRGDVEKHALVTEREEGWLCGTGCLLVRPGPGCRSKLFVSLHLDQPSIRTWIASRAVGATMPNLNTSILGDVPLLLPPTEVLEAFEFAAGPIEQRIGSLLEESKTLGNLRDLLLPKLVSGEIRVSDAERLLAAAPV